MTRPRMPAPYRATTMIATAAIALLGSLATGCSSSDFQTAPATDAGVEDTTTSDVIATADTRPLCIVPPAATGTEAAFCDFESKVYTRCGQCESCRQTNANGCVQFGGALSASFKQALSDCQDTIACGEYTSYLTDECIKPKLTAAVPTPAQAAVKDAYCSSCPVNPEECANFFDLSSFTGADAGPDAGSNRGIGAMVLVSSDDIAKSIAKDCKGGLNCNPSFFQVCAADKFCKQTPPDACNKGFCGK